MICESFGLSPAAILVQASSLSWSGGADLCMRVLDGKPLVERCLERARRLFPDVPIRVVAPEFDRGGLNGIASSVVNCQATYSFDDKPLKRMIAAVDDLADDQWILRIDGLHCFFQGNVVRDLIAAAESEKLDLAKSPDNFPPPLGGEVWRGWRAPPYRPHALRSACRNIGTALCASEISRDARGCRFAHADHRTVPGP